MNRYDTATGDADTVTPRPVVKVLFTSDTKRIEKAWQTDKSMVEADLEPDLVAALHLELAYSNGLLPPCLRQSGGMRAGFLRL